MKSVGFTGVDEISAVLYPTDKTPKRDTGEKSVHITRDQLLFCIPFRAFPHFSFGLLPQSAAGKAGRGSGPLSPLSLFPFGATWHETQKLANGGGGGKGGKQEVEEERKVAFWWSSLVGGKAGERPLGRGRGVAGRSVVVVTNIENGGGDGGRKRGRKRSPPTASRAVKAPLEGEGERGISLLRRWNLTSVVARADAAPPPKEKGRRIFFLASSVDGALPSHAMPSVWCWRERRILFFCGWRRRSRMEKRGEGGWYGV